LLKEEEAPVSILFHYLLFSAGAPRLSIPTPVPVGAQGFQIAVGTAGVEFGAAIATYPYQHFHHYPRHLA
jgi:hypothetical protein